MAIKSYAMEDKSFLKTFELLPCPKTINEVKLLKTKLSLLYKHKFKKQPQELFLRKTQEAVTLPEFSEVNSVMQLVRTLVPENLSPLEDQFGTEPTISVSSEAGSSAMQRMMSQASQSTAHPLYANPCIFCSRSTNGGELRLVASPFRCFGSPSTAVAWSPTCCALSGPRGGRKTARRWLPSQHTKLATGSPH